MDTYSIRTQGSFQTNPHFDAIFWIYQHNVKDSGKYTSHNKTSFLLPVWIMVCDEHKDTAVRYLEIPKSFYSA